MESIGAGFAALQVLGTTEEIKADGGPAIVLLGTCPNVEHVTSTQKPARKCLQQLCSWSPKLGSQQDGLR